MHRGYNDSAKDFKGSIKRLIIELKDYRNLILFSIFLAFFSSVLSILGPSGLSRLTDEISKGLYINTNIDFHKVKNISIFLISLYLCSGISNYIQSICMTSVSNKFAKNLRSKILIKTNKLPLKYFDKHQTGDTLSRVTNDVDMISHSMHHSLGSIVSSVTLFIGTIIMMFTTNYIMAITAVLASTIGFIGMSFILKNSQKYFIAKQKELGNLNGHIEEIYFGLSIVKVYNGTEMSSKQFKEYNKRVCEANKKSQFLSGLMQPIMGFVGNFGYVAVCIVGAILTKNNVITFGVIVAFMTYVRLFTSPLSQIAQSMTQLQSTAAASERVFEYLDEEEMTNQLNIKNTLDKAKVKGKVEFQNVVFKYDDSSKPVINNFSALIKPGQKIAIVGPTGAGKTTIVNLLMKFYEINSGDIKIDDISINELTRENIHNLFTMVLQDTWLFEGTIKENIIYNRNDITDDKIKEGVFKTLPHGVVVNEIVIILQADISHFSVSLIAVKAQIKGIERRINKEHQKRENKRRDKQVWNGFFLPPPAFVSLHVFNTFHGLKIKMIRICTKAFILIQFVNGLHFISSQFEIKDIDVFFLANRILRPGNHANPVLEMPAKNNLSRRTPMAGCDFFDNRFIQTFTLHERRIGLHNNSVFPAVGEKLFLAHQGITLHLEQHGQDARLFFERFQHVNMHIAGAKDPDFPCFILTDQILPCVDIFARNRPMNHVHVKIIHIDQLQALLKTLIFRSLAKILIPEFGRDKELIAGDAAEL